MTVCQPIPPVAESYFQTGRRYREGILNSRPKQVQSKRAREP